MLINIFNPIILYNLQRVAMNFRINNIKRYFTFSPQAKGKKQPTSLPSPKEQTSSPKEQTSSKISNKITAEPEKLDNANIEIAKKFLSEKIHKEQRESKKKGIPLEKRSLKKILEAAHKSEHPIKSLRKELIELQDQTEGHRFILDRIRKLITHYEKQQLKEARRIHPDKRRLCRMERTLLLHESKYLAKQQKLYKSEKDYMRVKKWIDELKTLTSTPPDPGQSTPFKDEFPPPPPPPPPVEELPIEDAPPPPPPPVEEPPMPTRAAPLPPVEEPPMPTRAAPELTIKMRLGSQKARKLLAEQIQKLSGKRVITIPLEHIEKLEKLLSKRFISRLWEIRQSFPPNYYQDLKHMEKQLKATLKDFVQNYKTLSLETLSSLITKRLYRENAPNLNAHVQEVLNSNNFKREATMILKDMQEYL